VLAATFTFIIVNAGQHLFSQPSYASPIPDEPKTTRTSAGHQKIAAWKTYASLKKSELFGPQTKKIVAPPPVIDPTPPETTLDLQLLGIVAQEGDAPDYANIYDSKSRSKDIYGVGDEILPGVRVVEIRSQEVIISSSGKRETIPMIFGGTNVAGRPGSRLGRGPGIPGRPTSRRGSSNQPIHVINDYQRYIYKAALMEQVNQNLASLMNNFRTSPNIVDGKPSGLSIDQVGTDPISSKSGIRTGDIIKKINGNDVSSLNSILELSESLKNARKISVVIERNGRHRTLVYTVKD
jgi:general secretion pathway protein C